MGILTIIYWILAIAVMILLLVNAIKSLKTDKEFRKYIKKQEALIDKQMRDMFLKDLKEISKLCEELKKEENKNG